METEKLVSALENTISFLQTSQSSAWSYMSINEIIEKLESEIAKVKGSKPVDTKLLRLLFAPTGDIPDTSIDNGWGDEFLKISGIVDQFVVNR